MTGHPRKMVDNARTVNRIRTAQQKRGPGGHVQQPPRTIVDTPSRLARLHTIGPQPGIGDTRRDRRAFAAIGRRRKIPQPVKTVDIIGQRWRQIEPVIIQRIKGLL